MNRQHNYKELGQETINNIANYFLENAQQEYATAVRNAAGQVLAYLNGNYSQRRFSRNVNRNLCEALFFMNSDPNCDYKKLIITRKLLENYRQLNGLPTDDFEAEIGPMEIVVDDEMHGPIDPMKDLETDGFTIDHEPIDDDECFGSECEHEEWEPETKDEEDNIIGAVEIGDVLEVSDYISRQCGPGDFRDRLSAEDDILDALKHLVNMGMFEVLDRDEYNGKISVVKRVR